MNDVRAFHGGDLGWAEAQFGRPERPWIDLSTGINPWPYPVGPIAAAAWTRLPDARDVDGLRAAAADYYGAPGPDCVVPAPGSQALIQLLPRLRPPGRVAVLGPTYGEHAPCWRAAGHDVETVGGDVLDGTWDVVVVTNPNNPDGATLAPGRLHALACGLASRGGWLVVDEAFADVAPEISLASTADLPGRIVLRSFGKFFGLAGLRLGCAIAPPDLARQIADALGPWAVSGPAIAVATRAYGDDAWIAETRQRLASAARRLDDVLGGAGLALAGGTSLFRFVTDPAAPALFQSLGEHGIAARHFPERPEWLRLGLPGNDAALDRLTEALAASAASVS